MRSKSSCTRPASAVHSYPAEHGSRVAQDGQVADAGAGPLAFEPSEEDERRRLNDGANDSDIYTFQHSLSARKGHRSRGRRANGRSPRQCPSRKSWNCIQNSHSQSKTCGRFYRLTTFSARSGSPRKSYGLTSDAAPCEAGSHADRLTAPAVSSMMGRSKDLGTRLGTLGAEKAWRWCCETVALIGKRGLAGNLGKLWAWLTQVSQTAGLQNPVPARV